MLCKGWLCLSLPCASHARVAAPPLPRILWHAILELVLFAFTAEMIVKLITTPEPLAWLKDWVKPAVVVIVLKLAYKVASMMANKALLEGDD